jgi:DNA-binding CsgD family transcriptional regulator
VTLYLDRHDLIGTQFENATPEEMLHAHQCDLQEQDKFGVNYLTYWWHEGAKTAFCLVEAPSRETAERVHREAHGPDGLPTQIIEVDWQTMEGFLGRVRIPPYDQVHQDIAFRTILCTEIEDPAASAGESAAPVPSSIVRSALDDRGGRAVNQTGDSLLASFPSATGALECALAIQRSFAPIASFYQDRPVRVRIGISAGEPVITLVGLFGEGVQEATSLCARAQPGEILVTSTVRDLCFDKGFAFKERAEASLEPNVQAAFYNLVGRDEAAPALGVLLDALVTYPDTLTAREIEVLRLIAAGKTNQEIGDLLFISLNTVATHVRNILEKTDSANRAEAACYALRRQLV